MLLLAMLPTIGRFVQSNPAMQQTLTAICTVEGMKFIDLGARSDLASPAEQAPEPMPHPGTDCDYCPVLASTLAAVAIVLLLPAPVRRAVPSPARRSLPGLGFLHPCGLGSRGPPLAL